MKNLINLFGKIVGNQTASDDYLKFTKDEFWTIAEAVDFTLIMNLDKINPESFAEYRKQYVDKFRDAIDRELFFVGGKLKNDVARDVYFVKEFSARPHQNGAIDAASIDSIKVACRSAGKINQKCLNKLDVIEFIACKNMIDDCDLKKTGLQIHSRLNSKTKITIERPVNAPLTHQERGGRKYHKIREFSNDVIKDLARQELDAGCLCLHYKIVERISTTVKEKADSQLQGKAHQNFMQKSNDHINKAVKELFYSLNEQFDNVKSRVYRGDYYDEHCKRQPSPVSCGIPSHKK